MSEDQQATVALPSSLEAEQALLGAILTQNDCYGLVCDFLKAEHFYEPLHGAIYEAAGTMIVSGKLCKPHLLAPLMPPQDLGDGITLSRYLSRLAASATTVSGAFAYGQAILEMATRRSIITVADIATRKAMGMGADSSPSQLIEEITEELASLGSSVSVKRSEPESISVAAKEAVLQANEVRAGRVKLDIIHTGIPSLDRKMGGIVRGNHVVIAGRPGSGKSALSLQIALNIARSKPVLFFSMEMSNIEISHRAISSLAFRGFGGIQLPYQLLRDPNELDNRQMDLFIDTEVVLRNYHLIVDQTSNLSIEQIAMRAKMINARLSLKGKKLGAVFIDHLGLVKPPRGVQSRVHQIEHITNTAKSIGKEIDAPVFSLAQLNRNVEMRDDKRPQLSDLRDSGSIEQDADFVIGAYRDDYYVSKGIWKPRHEKDVPEGTNTFEAHILKNRHGGEANVSLFCDMPHNVISDQYHSSSASDAL